MLLEDRVRNTSGLATIHPEPKDFEEYKSAKRASTSQTVSGKLCDPTPDDFVNRETRDRLLAVAALRIRLVRGRRRPALWNNLPKSISLFPVVCG